MAAPTGEEIYYCAECGWVHAPNGYTGTCPNCHSISRIMRCSRCMHAWWPKGNVVPKVCPRCKSPYWNRVRSRRKENKNMEEDRGDN